MIPAFLELPLPTPIVPGFRPLQGPPTILPMSAQICKLFNLIDSRVTGVTLCYLESLILELTYPLYNN